MEEFLYEQNDSSISSIGFLPLPEVKDQDIAFALYHLKRNSPASCSTASQDVHTPEYITGTFPEYCQ